jgi:hypothetical protein
VQCLPFEAIDQSIAYIDHLNAHKAIKFSIIYSLATYITNYPKTGQTSNKLLSTIFYRSIEAWNNTPVDLRLLPSLPAFKHGLKS